MDIIAMGHVDAAGFLSIAPIQTSLPEAEFKVVLTIHEKIESHSESFGWPAHFIDTYYGCLADDPIEEI